MQISSESEAEIMPHEISNSAKAATYELLPVNSRERYKLVYNSFQKWIHDKNVHSINEQVIIQWKHLKC